METPSGVRHFILIFSEAINLKKAWNIFFLLSVRNTSLDALQNKNAILTFTFFFT